MGCNGSKLDDLPAVALCRDRSDLLAYAIHHRYALAAAHSAYADSLRSVGTSLHRLLLDGGDHEHLPPSSSPVLPLPTQRKGDPFPVPSPSPPPAAVHHSHSHSHSGSHIDFHSDSDGDSSLHSDGDSPLHFHPSPAKTLGPTFVGLHYARDHPPAPSVSYEQRPQSSETVHFGSVEPSDYGNQNPSPQPYAYPYAYPPNDYSYGGAGGFFGPSSPPPAAALPPPAAEAGAGPSSSSSRPPPSPPSPPKTSNWDFLDPFRSFDTYYPPYIPSRHSKEVREEERIPDLEDEQEEVVKEAYGDRKSMASISAETLEEYRRKLPSSSKDDGVDNYVGHSHNRSRSVGAGSSTEDEDDVVEKNVAHEERRSVTAAAAPGRYGDVSVVVGEIKTQFDRASESALELARMLEVGKRPYRRKNSVCSVSSRMMRAMNFPSSSSNEDLLIFEEDMVMNSRSLSSTLHKLYMWEQKLYDEVRAEEKMRLLHDKKCTELKHLDETGAEAHKIDTTRNLIRKLSTKLRIEIQVVHSISKKINKLMEEELCRQISEIIQGLTKMWKVMLECHRAQCRTISEAKSLDSIASGGKLSDARLDAVMQLELELLRWIGNFSDWISAQKSFVKALNGWLILCLNREPEVTADGVPPYSPGRIGAPPVYIICNYWSQAMDRISEKEVVDAMQSFASNLRGLWEQSDVEQRQKMMANRDMDRWLKDREREAQTIHKELDALNKKLVVVSGLNGPPLYGVVAHQGHDAEVSSLQLGLKQMFEAIENFTASSVKAYEELHLRSEEERVSRENAKDP